MSIREGVLVDSNVLIDILQDDPVWAEWSGRELARVAGRTRLVINPTVYAEISIGFTRIEELEAALALFDFQREETSWEAAFLAGKAFSRYRKRGGRKTSPLPDFFIGAHAAVAGLTLLTRDPRRYRDYFPGLALIAPTSAESR